MTPDEADRFSHLERQIANLEEIVHNMRQQKTPQYDAYRDPRPRIFMLQKTSLGSHTYKEQIINSSAPADYVDGRVVAADSLSGALLEPEDSLSIGFGMEFIDPADRKAKVVKVSTAGSTGGTITPQDTIGSATDDGGSEAAESSTWARSGGHSLKFTVMSRVGYFDAGDMKLYGYMRNIIIDTAGGWYSLGAESRVTIDIPDSCAGSGGF